MSYFPILIKLVDSGENVLVNDPKDIPSGVTVIVLATQVKTPSKDEEVSVLALVKHKLVVGDMVGYRDKFDTGLNGFLPENIGVVTSILQKTYYVKFPDGLGPFELSQLVLIK